MSYSLILFDRSLCSFSASFLNSLGMYADMSFQFCECDCRISECGLSKQFWRKIIFGPAFLVIRNKLVYNIKCLMMECYVFLVRKKAGACLIHVACLYPCKMLRINKNPNFSVWIFRTFSCIYFLNYRGSFLSSFESH